MSSRYWLIQFFSVLMVCASIAHSQYSLSFLTFAPSAEANGAGGIMSSVVSSSPSSMIFNPAQLGSISRNTTFSSEFYTPGSQLPLRFGISVNPSIYDSYSLQYGTLYGSVSLGIGYSRIIMDWGMMSHVSGSNPNERRTIHPFETSDNLSIGAGFQWGMTTGAIGITYKQITSRLPGYSATGSLVEGTAKPTAADIGMMFTIPLAAYFHTPDRSVPALFTDLTVAYAVNNIGGDVVYVDQPQSDPLPEIARLGGSISAGYRMMYRDRTYTLFSMMIAREAEEFLFHRRYGPSAEHKYFPVQEMNPFASIISGRFVNDIPVRKGFSVTVLETFTLLSGLYQPYEHERITTSGASFSTNGIFTLLQSIFPAGAHPTAASILNTLELRFNRSVLSGSGSFGAISVFPKGTYTSMVISLHH